MPNTDRRRVPAPVPHHGHAVSEHGVVDQTRRWACRDDIVARALAAPARNVELKARGADPGRTLALVLGLGAEERGTIAQRDTYYTCATGRSKLREQEPGGAELIQYSRPDEEEASTSAYRRVPVPDPEVLGEALAAALGTVVVVRKERRLLLREGVRMGELLPPAFEPSAGGEEA